MNFTPEQITIISSALSAFGGAVASEGIRWLRSRGKEKIDDATQIRKEMREQNETLTKRLDQVTNELDSWRSKYYELLGRWTVQEGENVELRKENADLNKQVNDLRVEIKVLRELGQPGKPSKSN